ncbi:MAG TPA: dTDP-4-dehydrorhamnose 3,5-epimerase [Elusimicrobiales bacterium]|nr:dTDP-4-dehydrorhamnose 3,5-epimerase [Elusimicrobiales bacterium]
MPFEFQGLDIPGPILVTPKSFPDRRGLFGETYKADDFRAAGITDVFVQDNLSFSVKHVVRGLHYQKSRAAQAKLVCCLSGKIFDVAVDIRKGSLHYGKWAGCVLDGDKWQMLYVPEGFAHGFSVLSEGALVAYKVNRFYCPEESRGITFDDKTLSVDWRVEKAVLSDADKKLPELAACDNDFVFR